MAYGNHDKLWVVCRECGRNYYVTVSRLNTVSGSRCDHCPGKLDPIRGEYIPSPGSHPERNYPKLEKVMCPKCGVIMKKKNLDKHQSRCPGRRQF